MRRENVRGFTLIEMLIVMGIVMLLATLVTAGIIRAKNRARETAARQTVQQIHSALQRYRAQYLFWPNTASFTANEQIDERQPTQIGHSFAQILGGAEVSGQNARKIHFCSFTTCDADGSPITTFSVDTNRVPLLHFYARFDTDLNGRVEKGSGSDPSDPATYPPTAVAGEVVVWTFNPTEDSASPRFVIGSWQ